MSDKGCHGEQSDQSQEPMIACNMGNRVVSMSKGIARANKLTSLSELVGVIAGTHPEVFQGAQHAFADPACGHA